MARNQWQDWINSPFYALYYEATAPSAVSPALLSIIKKSRKAAGQQILIAGCGTGKGCEELAALGYDVTGTDYSFALIEKALTIQHERLHFYQHDLRLPFWSNYFQLAFCTAAAFGHYDTRREHENLLRTIAGSLLPGGVLVLEHSGTGVHEQDADSKQLIGDTFYSVEQRVDESHYYARITVTDPSLVEPVHYIKQKEKFSVAELTGMLENQGLSVQAMYGDDSLGKFDERTSGKIVMVAKKLAAGKEDAEKRLYSDGRTGDALT